MTDKRQKFIFGGISDGSNSILVEEESIDSRFKTLKLKIDSLGSLLETKKQLNPKDNFINRMQLFYNKSVENIKTLETMIARYQGEYERLKVKFFPEDTSVKKRDIFESITIFLTDLQVWDLLRSSEICIRSVLHCSVLQRAKIKKRVFPIIAAPA